MNPWAIAGLGAVAWVTGGVIAAESISFDPDHPGSEAAQVGGTLLAVGGFAATVTGVVLGVKQASEKPRRKRLRAR